MEDDRLINNMSPSHADYYYQHSGDTPPPSSSESSSDESDRPTISFDSPSVKAKIQNHFRENRPRSEIFSILYRELYSKDLTTDQLSLCFPASTEHLSNAEYNNEDFKLRNMPLIVVVVEECGQLRHEISKWYKLPYSKFAFLDSRYALVLENNCYVKSLFLLDNYYGQKRQLRIEGSFPPSTESEYEMEVIDFEFILLFNQCQRGMFDVHLLRLNFEETTCTLVDTVRRLEGKFLLAPFDCKNRRHFAIYARLNQNYCLYVTDVENSCLAINSQPIQIEYRLSHKWLDGNKLKIINVVNTEQIPTKELRLGEYLLISGRDNPLFNETCKVQIDVPLEYNNTNCAFWTPNACYLIDGDAPTNQTILYIINLTTYQLTTTKYEFYFDDVLEVVHVDEENGIMTLCYNDSTDRLFRVYRFCFNQPDRLKILVHFKLQRDSLFFNNKLYDKVRCKMPALMRPLAICPEDSDSSSVSLIDEPVASTSTKNTDEPAEKRQRIK